MFGRQPAFCLKGLNIPDELIETFETQDELIAVLGKEHNPDEKVVEEVLPSDNEIRLMEVPDNFEVHTSENIPFVWSHQKKSALYL